MTLLIFEVLRNYEEVVTLAGEGWNMEVSIVVVHSTSYEQMISLLLTEAYRKVAHTAKPSLDEMPFPCFIATLLWLQNSPSFAQADCFPFMHGRKLHILDLL
jgi:hypothetical protein